MFAGSGVAEQRLLKRTKTLSDLSPATRDPSRIRLRFVGIGDGDRAYAPEKGKEGAEVKTPHREMPVSLFAAAKDFKKPSPR